MTNVIRGDKLGLTREGAAWKLVPIVYDRWCLEGGDDHRYMLQRTETHSPPFSSFKPRTTVSDVWRARVGGNQWVPEGFPACLPRSEVITHEAPRADEASGDSVRVCQDGWTWVRRGVWVKRLPMELHLTWLSIPGTRWFQ
ncbi:hypothetical protein RchiOBHm_Chr5g0047131 [Rosa chinensis]|uniref:Uncharacterized protein n=1 Tax=Rosa chinensis TaxID=74649 RepID=A0A2P6QEB4_ROSCH|nr:hypothetical protein RchiOBHm_Chr5g0047131 [Rosa chinensis]